MNCLLAASVLFVSSNCLHGDIFSNKEYRLPFEESSFIIKDKSKFTAVNKQRVSARNNSKKLEQVNGFDYQATTDTTVQIIRSDVYADLSERSSHFEFNVKTDW